MFPAFDLGTGLAGFYQANQSDSRKQMDYRLESEKPSFHRLLFQ